MHYQRPCRQRAKGSFHIMAQTNYRCHLGSCRKTTLLWYVIKIRYSGLWEKRYILSIILIQNLARSRWFCRFQWDNLLGMCKIVRIHNWDAYWYKNVYCMLPKTIRKHCFERHTMFASFSIRVTRHLKEVTLCAKKLMIVSCRKICSSINFLDNLLEKCIFIFCK